MSLVTLGCARNEVDSEELAARLEAGGWQLADDGAGRRHRPRQHLRLHPGGEAGVHRRAARAPPRAAPRWSPPGCLAERYGSGLAEALPEAQSPQLRRLRRTSRPGSTRSPQASAGPRTSRGTGAGCCRLSPAERPAAARRSPVIAPLITDLPPGVAPASGPRVLRRRLGGAVVAPLKIASGCDRRCTFCAIPAFRGAFVSRRPEDLIAEAAWLADHGARELLLVSENSTSYGKDLGDLRLLESLLPQLAAVEGICRVRVSYLQPAEVRPGLIEVLAGTPGVAPYFDLSFQHASGPVLRSMRGSATGSGSCELLAQVRQAAPGRGRAVELHRRASPARPRLTCRSCRTSWPRRGSTPSACSATRTRTAPRPLTCPASSPEDEIAARLEELAGLADELMAERAAERIGEHAEVLIDEVLGGDRLPGPGRAPGARGRRHHRGRDREAPRPGPATCCATVVTGSDGVDLIAATPDMSPRAHLTQPAADVSGDGVSGAGAANARARHRQRRQRADRGQARPGPGLRLVPACRRHRRAHDRLRGLRRRVGDRPARRGTGPAARADHGLRQDR